MKVAKWGNSLAIRIPADVARELGLQEGDEVSLEACAGGGLTILSERQRREEALARLRSLRGSFPADFKFDREEANARR